MESQNKLFEEFKAAAAADEQTTFLAQDKLWGRIEQQLDKEEQKSIKMFSFNGIKYMAAAVLLIAGIALSWNLLFPAKDNENSLLVKERVPAPSQVKLEKPVLSLPEHVEELAPKQPGSSPRPKPSVVVAQEEVAVMPEKEETVIEELPNRLVLHNFNKGPEDFNYRFEHNKEPLSDHDLSIAATPQPAEPANEFPADRLFNIQGVVVDKAGIPLPNAKVSIKGTERLATSDAQGKFALQVPDTAEFILVHSYGNETKSVRIGERVNYKIEVSPDRNNVALLNDITTYGRQRTAGLTNTQEQANNYAQQLASKQRKQALSSVKIASKDPMIVVNGVPYSGSISDINTRHIKEIKVLTEAAARALYGNRGSNGVILITLKKGKQLIPISTDKK